MIVDGSLLHLGPYNWALGHPMKPRRLRYFFAHGIEIAAIGGALSMALWIASLFNGVFSVWAVYGSLVALPLGAILGMLFVWPVIHTICGRLNGAPFFKGDNVRVLVGPYRDCVTRVYDVWSSRGQVRVELSEQAAKAVTDVLWYNQVCRERDEPRTLTFPEETVRIWTTYGRELFELALRIKRSGATASVRGDGAGRFIFAEYGARAIEISRNGHEWWVEFWDDDRVAAERTFQSAEEVLQAASGWLMMSQA